MSQQITFIIADNQDITALALHAIVTEMHPEAVAIDVHDKRQLIDRLDTAEGKTAKEIASLRNSSIHTIITHKKNIFHKLEVNSTYESTKYAIRAGIAEAIEYYI